VSLEVYLQGMAHKGASDLSFTSGAPLAMRVEGEIGPLGKQPLDTGVTAKLPPSKRTTSACSGLDCSTTRWPTR